MSGEPFFINQDKNQELHLANEGYIDWTSHRPTVGK